MPIRDYPFSVVTPNNPRPMLWVRVINPDTNLAFEALAIVDTGADDCVFPAPVATALGHNLRSVKPKRIDTAGGNTYAWPHTSRVDVLEMLPNGRAGNRVLYTIPDTPIDFAEHCPAFLLGRRKFLSNFILTVDYPGLCFSIRKPLKHK